MTKMDCIFGIAAMICGVTIFASLIAGLAAMQSARITPHSSKYRSRVLTQFCSSLEISSLTREQVLSYDKQKSDSIGEIDDSNFLENVIPHHYRCEFMEIMGIDLVQSANSMFRICSNSVNA